MIRKMLLSTVALAAFTSAAFAADLPSRRAPPVYIPPPLPVFSWTGFYIGADVGYAFGSDNNFLVNTATGGVAAYSTGRPNGTIGGAHVGYNFSTQSLPVIGTFASAISGVPFIGGVGGSGGVFGIEGDVRGGDYRGTVSPIPTLGAGSLEQSRNNIQGTVRGRLGIAVDRALFFATGGVAFASFRNQYADGLGDVNSNSTTRTGYVVGGGIEYALTTNFSLRGEYRYEDFGRYTQTIFPAGLAGAPLTFSHRDIENQVTVGFSYKFDTIAPAPVVARY